MTEFNPVQNIPSVAPVTREETESFFQRLATNFVRMSAQDQEIKAMREEVGVLSQRLTRFLGENDKLKNEVTTAYELMKSIEQERDTAKRDLQEEQAATSHLREQLQERGDIIGRATERNRELERLVAELQANLSQSNSERNAFQTNCDYWQNRASDYEDRFDAERIVSGAANREWLEACTQRDKLQSRLDQMKSILSPPEDQPTQAESLPF